VDPTSSIRRLGFRKWYERELIKCHAALVTCLLSGLLVAALFETVNLREVGWTLVSELAVVFAAIATGIVSWRTYITILQRAELYGESSNCPNCHAYGRFKVIATGLDAHPGPTAEAVAPLEAAWLRVECNKCGTPWRMPE
jgi:flagellar biosynthesis protein FliQ